MNQIAHRNWSRAQAKSAHADELSAKAPSCVYYSDLTASQVQAVVRAPMQIIYAAPFILLSLVAFVLSLAIPRLRPYAFRALVAPVAFGFCSIVAMVLILVASHGLNLRFANAPLSGARGLFEGIAIYLVPGLVGAWIAVEIVRQVEVRALKTRARREFATRTIIALIVFGPVFIVCTGVQFNIFSRAEEWRPAFLVNLGTDGTFPSFATKMGNWQESPARKERQPDRKPSHF